MQEDEETQQDREQRMIKCPKCKKMVTATHFSCFAGAKGGRKGTGKAKARTSDQARAAIMARWNKHFAGA